MVKKILGVFLASVLYALLSQAIHTANIFLSVKYYVDPEFAKIWSDLMLLSPGLDIPTYMMYTLGFGFVTGLLFSVIYIFMLPLLVVPSKLQKGLLYGIVLFIMITLPTSLRNSLLLDLPIEVVAGWIFEAFAAFTLGGIVISSLLTPPPRVIDAS